MNIHLPVLPLASLCFIVAVATVSHAQTEIGVRKCDNSTETFSICWDPLPNVIGYCTYLRNFLGFPSEYFFTDADETELSYTFGELELGFSYRGCVLPIPDTIDQTEVDCEEEIANGADSISCVMFQSSGRGWTVQNSLAVACSAYIVLLFAVVKLAGNLCPYVRKTTLNFEEFYLHSERKLLKKEMKKKELNEKVESIRERARKRSDLVAMIVSSPSSASRTPSLSSGVPATSPSDSPDTADEAVSGQKFFP